MTLPAHTLAHWRTELARGHCSARQLVECALDAALHGNESQATFLEVHTSAARACAEAVDRHLMGESNLPRAVEPTDMPLGV